MWRKGEFGVSKQAAKPRCATQVKSISTVMFLCLNAVSAAGSTGGAFGDATARSSGNLDAVEEADIEAGEILTTLKSSPSPIRFVYSSVSST